MATSLRDRILARRRPLIGAAALLLLGIGGAAYVQRALRERDQDLQARLRARHQHQERRAERPTHARPALAEGFDELLAPHRAAIARVAAPVDDEHRCPPLHSQIIAGEEPIAALPGPWSQALARHQGLIDAALRAPQGQRGPDPAGAALPQLATVAQLALLRGRQQLAAGDVAAAADTCVHALGLFRDAGTLDRDATGKVLLWELRLPVALCLDVLAAASAAQRQELVAPLRALHAVQPDESSALEDRLLDHERRLFGGPHRCDNDPATVPGTGLFERWRLVAGVALRAAPLCALRTLTLWSRYRTVAGRVLAAAQLPEDERAVELERLALEPRLRRFYDEVECGVTQASQDLQHHRAYMDLLLTAALLLAEQGRDGAWPRALPGGSAGIEPRDPVLNRPLTRVLLPDGRLALAFAGPASLRAEAALPGPTLRTRKGNVVLLLPPAR